MKKNTLKRLYPSLLAGILAFPIMALADNHPIFENFEQPIEEEVGSSTRSESDMPLLLKVSVHTRNFSAQSMIKMNKAIEILEVVMNSKELKDRIVNYSYEGKVGFYQNNGMSNIQIYNHLMTGAENLKPEVNHTMDFDLTLYRSLNPWSTVKGYTKPDTMRIWLHSKYYKKSTWTALDVAANMAHEWVHKMGFGHDYYYSEIRQFSVPYAVGGLVTKVAKQLGY
jgi:hypothetical protein